MTEVDLRDYVDMRFGEADKAVKAALEAQEKAVKAALESSEKAVDKAEANSEKWRASANEWRGAMSDRDRELPSRREVDGIVDALAARLTILEKSQNHDAGRSEGVNTIYAVITAIAAVAAIVAVVVSLSP